jgi:ABC-type Mn2+/Zn2+ transport system permease subunit
MLIVPITITLYAAYYIHYYPVASLAMLFATLAFGVLGSLVAARKLYFLAGAAPHSALLAALLGVLFSSLTGLPPKPLVIILAIILVYLVGYPLFRGLDPDVVTALFVSLISSLSVILVYVVIKVSPVTYNISSLVFGDPLLATEEDLPVIVVVSMVTATASIATYKEQVLIGFNREQVVLSGLKIWIYDLLFFTVLGMSLAALLPIMGFILEHVLVLLPGVISLSARSSRDALLYAVSSALLAGALGLWVSVLLDVSPAGSTGLMLFIIYLASLLLGKRG